MTRLRTHLLWILAAVACTTAAAAEEVGTVAAVEGTAEIGSGGAWTPAVIGTAIHRGDELRTGRPGRLRIVFQDDSVIAIADDSHVTVDESVFNPDRGKTKSVLELLQGKVNAVVSEYYHRAGAAYEIKTATAVAGVRGTEFAMTYDPAQQVTEVFGIAGHVEVRSLVDPTAPGVLLTANEATAVWLGHEPTAPRRIENSIFRQQMEGIDFIGRGRPESLSRGVTPLVLASAPVAATTNPVTRGAPDVSNLCGQAPAIVKAMTGQLGIDLGNRPPK